MPYIGNTIRAADDYRLIDDISSGFNGSATSFALQVAGSAPVPFPKSPQQVLISVNGVIQEPDPTGASGFNLVGTNIVFSSAPTNGHAFFGIIYATADYLNAGGNFPAGSLGAPSITFIGDENTGLFRKSGGSVGFVSDATEISNFDSNGITISSGNLIIPDSIIHNGDTDTKIRFSGTDQVKIETAGTERVHIDGVEVVFNETGVNTDFKIEGDSVSNLFKVDASVDNIGIGMALPKFSSGNGIELADNFFLGFGSGNGTRPDFQFGTTAGATLDIRCGTGADTVDMVISTSGHVGIGTTSPSGILHTKTSGGEGLRLQGTATSSFLRFTDASNNSTGFIGQDTIFTIANQSNTDMRFNTNNTERMRIDSSGRLLIGRTTPSNTNGTGAEVYISDNTTYSATSNNVNGLVVTNNSGVDNGFAGIELRASNAAGHVGTVLLKAIADGTNYSNDFVIQTRHGGNWGERMRIDSAGNIGIGTASPNELFHVSGNSSGAISAKIENIYSSDATRFAILELKSGVGSIRFHDQGDTLEGEIKYDSTNNFMSFATNGNSERMRIDSSGRVGIGTTSMSSALNVYHATNNEMAKFESGDEYVHIVFKDSTTSSDPYIGAQGNNFRIITGGAERMRIDSSGNILIAQASTTSPGQGNTTAGIALNPTGRGNFSGTNTAAILVQRSNDGIAQLLYRGGVLQGNISVSSSGITFNSTSDYRLKENVVSISDGITRLKTLKPSRFNFIADAETTVDGFLAHEVTAVPEAITGIKDAVAVQSDVDEGIAAKIGDPVYQTIDQSKLVPLLVAALQEEITKREALETRIAALEAA